MPDISKLPELCKILNISFEELVGERTVETDIAEKLMQDENADVSIEEMAQIGQLIKPDKIESKANEAIAKGDKVSFSTLVSLAPFMDKKNLSEHGQSNKLVAIAPFMGSAMFPKLSKDKKESNSISIHIELDDLDEDEVAKLAFEMLEQGKDVTKYLDSMDEEDVAKLAFRALELDKKTEVFLPYMDEDDIRRLLLKSVRR